MAIRLETLTQRHEFLRVQAAPRVGTATLVLHRLPNPTLAEGASRVGFTVTKRCGGAVERNRIKRRLRAAVRQIIGRIGEPLTDYVIIGKPATLNAPFDHITRDLTYAVKRHAKHTPPHTA